MMTVTINFKETTFNVTFNANPEFKNAIDAIHCAAFVFSKIGTRENHYICNNYPFLESVKDQFGNSYYTDLIQRNQVIIKAIESHYKVEFNNVNVLPQLHSMVYDYKFNFITYDLHNELAITQHLRSPKNITWNCKPELQNIQPLKKLKNILDY